MPYKVIMLYSDGTEEEEDEIFETIEEANEHGEYCCSCFHQGGETLSLSNPGDYPYDEDEEVNFRIKKV